LKLTLHLYFNTGVAHPCASCLAPGCVSLAFPGLFFQPGCNHGQKASRRSIDRMIIAAAVWCWLAWQPQVDRLDSRHVSGVGGKWEAVQKEREKYLKLAICNSLSKLINPICHFWLLALISPFNPTTQVELKLK